MDLAASIETFGWRRRITRFRTGFAATSKPDIRFHDTGMTQFRYRERGSGRTILFVADPPMTLEGYDDLFEVWSRDFRVVVVEPPSMGFSAVRGGFSFSFEESNREIIAFMDAIVGPGAVTAFSCVAGLGSHAIAAERPDLVSHVVLIQTPSWSEEVRWKKARDPKGILARPVIGQLAMQKLKQTRAPMWLTLAAGSTPHLASWCDCARTTLAEGAGWGLASAFQRYLTDDSQLDAPISQPLLILWGERDGSHTTTITDSARDHAASSVEAIRYADLGHFPEVENPERVRSDVSAWLSAIDSPDNSRRTTSRT